MTLYDKAQLVTTAAQEKHMTGRIWAKDESERLADALIERLNRP